MREARRAEDIKTAADLLKCNGRTRRHERWRVRPKSPGSPMTVMAIMVPVVMMTIVVVAVVVVPVVVMAAPMHQLHRAGRIGLCGLESLRHSRGRGSLRRRSHCYPSQHHGRCR